MHFCRHQPVLTASITMQMVVSEKVGTKNSAQLSSAKPPPVRPLPSLPTARQAARGHHLSAHTVTSDPPCGLKYAVLNAIFTKKSRHTVLILQRLARRNHGSKFNSNNQVETRTNNNIIWGAKGNYESPGAGHRRPSLKRLLAWQVPLSELWHFGINCVCTNKICRHQKSLC